MGTSETKIWTKAEIIEKLETDDRWVQRAITRLFSEQTADERAAMRTKYRNKRGFSAFDAKFLSALARRIHHRGHLFDPEIKKARPRLIKYAGQLAKIANRG